jgi:hypothetical protein
VLRRVFGPQRDELIGWCRKLHNEEFYEFYSSPNIIMITNSRRVRWHVGQPKKDIGRKARKKETVTKGKS